MKLSKKEVEHIALLARLNLNEEEKERFREQLSSILDYVDQLQALDTADLEPLSTVNLELLRLREDEIKDSLSIEALMRNAPKEKGRHFQVPLILDGQDE